MEDSKRENMKNHIKELLSEGPVSQKIPYNSIDMPEDKIEKEINKKGTIPQEIVVKSIDRNVLPVLRQLTKSGKVCRQLMESDDLKCRLDGKGRDDTTGLVE